MSRPWRSVDDAAALARALVIAARLRLRIGHEDHAVEGLDPERGEALRELRVGERAVPGLLGERPVEDVDPAVVEVGRVEVLLGAVADIGRADREALVDGVAGIVTVADLGARSAEGAAPAEDVAALAIEQEVVAVEVIARCR